MAITLTEKLTRETQKVTKGSKTIILTKAIWTIKVGDNIHIETELWVRDREHEERQTTCGTGVPYALREVREAEHKSPNQAKRGKVRLLQEIKGDGKASVLTILEIQGEKFLWNRDLNKGRAVKWSKALVQALDLYMDFPTRASQIPFINTMETEYQDPLAFRGKELTLAPSSYKAKKVAEETAEGALAELQEQEIVLVKEETPAGIDFTALSYKALQEIAKEHGIKANQKRETLERELQKKLA